MNMKILFTFIFIIISPNIFASNLEVWNKWIKESLTPIDGEMKCKITDQIIFEVKEGKPLRYSHFTKKPKIDDTLTFTYSSWNEKIKVILKHPQEEYLNDLLDASKGKGTNSKYINFYNNILGKKYINISRDSIEMEKSVLGLVHYLSMDRYYKSDWQGVFTRIFDTQTQILSLDCRHTKDKIDEMLNLYKKYPGKLNTKK